MLFLWTRDKERGLRMSQKNLALVFCSIQNRISQSCPEQCRRIKNSSSDYLVRPRQHIRRNRQADLLGGLEIDDQVELRWLLHGQVARLDPLQNFVNVSRGAPEQ